MYDYIADIEKVIVGTMHEHMSPSCNFVDNGIRYFSDGYCIWMIDESMLGVHDFHVQYTNTDKMKKQVRTLIEKYKDHPCKKVDDTHTVLSNSMYKMRKFANEHFSVWLNQTYLDSFKMFEYDIYAVTFGKETPVLVKSGGELIGMFQPMHTPDDFCQNEDVLIEKDLNK